ncbi:glycosyltransferase [Actibacterium sp. XHP0104]|uniref:glycosyltransferase n=1 Tax=Actibacterium sp. XHP0104 TaxID=2984335 RepID=UPI0021E7E275|nr:glycosyltransferase family 2 protein [Actibacterium sp. XHP0104]MCV2881843.1 glycosyltransferase [Actibacterium sp. XHP0104]
MSTDSPTEISVVIPSYNGADTLDRCLSTVASVQKPEGAIEFLLVDNASTDETVTIMKRHAEGLGATVLHQPLSGKSHALNLALSHARGEFVVFWDDDVLPEPGCLRAYVQAARSHPDITLFGGQIRPEWVGKKPQRWLVFLTDIGKSWGCTRLNRPQEEMVFSDVKGGNMMVRRADLGTIRFDTEELNYAGTGIAGGGEDTGFAGSVSAKGGRLLYVPDACVKHMIQPDEMTRRAVFRRYYRIGRSNIARSGEGADPVTLRDWFVTAQILLAAVYFSVTLRPKVAARRMVSGAMKMGEVRARREMTTKP